MAVSKVNLFVEELGHEVLIEIDDKYAVDRVKSDLAAALKLKGEDFELQLIDAFTLHDGVAMRLVTQSTSAVKILSSSD